MLLSIANLSFLIPPQICVIFCPGYPVAVVFCFGFNVRKQSKEHGKLRIHEQIRISGKVRVKNTAFMYILEKGKYSNILLLKYILLL